MGSRPRVQLLTRSTEDADHQPHGAQGLQGPDYVTPGTNKKCGFCDYTAVQLTTVSQHIKAVHEKIQDKNCDYAGAWSYSLKSHMRKWHLTN
jgi:hypothetical protein